MILEQKTKFSSTNLLSLPPCHVHSGELHSGLSPLNTLSGPVPMIPWTCPLFDASTRLMGLADYQGPRSPREPIQQKSRLLGFGLWFSQGSAAFISRVGWAVRDDRGQDEEGWGGRLGGRQMALKSKTFYSFWTGLQKGLSKSGLRVKISFLFLGSLTWLLLSQRKKRWTPNGKKKQNTVSGSSMSIGGFSNTKQDLVTDAWQMTLKNHLAVLKSHLKIDFNHIKLGIFLINRVFTSFNDFYIYQPTHLICNPSRAPYKVVSNSLW